MYKLLDRSGMAILISLLVIVSSDPVFAKPQPRSKVTAISQAAPKDNVIDAISPQPVEAILANARLKAFTQRKVGKAFTHQVVTSKSVAQTIKTDDRVNDRSFQGLASFTDVDRVKNQPNHTLAIDRLVK